jgi:hypothetical protein
MRQAPAISAGAALRAIAFGAGLCGLIAGVSCRSETWDLLLDSGGRSGLSTAGAGSTSALSGGNAGGDSGDGDLDGSAGKSGIGGRTGASGAAGTASQAGNGSLGPCLAGEQCTDGGVICPPSALLCDRCQTMKDCTSNDSPLCVDGRCAECDVHGTDCAANEICYPITLRCATACKMDADCASDHDHPWCDSFGACVACRSNANCGMAHGHTANYCYLSECVDCFADKQCPADEVCVGLRCQSK